MRLSRIIFLCFAGLAASFDLVAQDTIFDKNTLERIPYYEQLYRFRVHRIVDLKEKQNAAFSSPKSSITNFILDLMEDDCKLKTYMPGNMTNSSPGDLLEENPDCKAPLVGKELFPATELLRGGETWSPKNDYLVNDEILWTVKNEKGKDVVHVFKCLNPNGILGTESLGKNQPKPKKGAPPAVTEPLKPDDKNAAFDWGDLGARFEEFNRGNVVALEIVEDVVFDKRRSRLYYDILAVGIATVSEQGDLGTKFYISYKQFAQRVSEFYKKDMASRRKVMWQNRYNPSENRTYTDAFKLRLFHGVVSKVENPDDLTITEIITGGDKGKYNESVFARWEEEMKMMEKEHNLWEF